MLRMDKWTVKRPQSNMSCHLLRSSEHNLSPLFSSLEPKAQDEILWSFTVRLSVHTFKGLLLWNSCVILSSPVRKYRKRFWTTPGVGIGVGVSKNVKILRHSFKDLIFYKSSDGLCPYRRVGDILCLRQCHSRQCRAGHDDTSRTRMTNLAFLLLELSPFVLYLKLILCPLSNSNTVRNILMVFGRNVE